MIKAYLQNKKAKYYCLADDGSVTLGDLKKSLQSVPEVADKANKDNSNKINALEIAQAVFIFRNDGCRILSWLFFTKGTEADCILTIEQDDAVCGDLDFSTARIYGQKEVRINCRYF